MSKKKVLSLSLFLFLLLNCSFDHKTGIWTQENKRIKKIEKIQKRANVDKIYSTTSIFDQEIDLKIKINLSKPKKNSSWETNGLNNQNLLGNIYLPSIDNKFLEKKVSKNKFSLFRNPTSPLVYKNYIFVSDDRGTVFNISQGGQINWKRNIYKNIYKKIYKNLTFAIYNNNIYVSDNIGFIYAFNLDNGELIWIKSHGVPLKSKIKIFNDMIFLTNQDNRLIALSAKDGSIVWDIRSISSFIKSQNLLSLAISKQGDLIAVTTVGDLLKVNSKNGAVRWSLNTTGSSLTHDSDFFKSSDIVITDGSIIFSTESSIFSYNLSNGYTNWARNVSSIATSIIDRENIFFVTENGYFVIMNINDGKIISSTNILKILKKRKQNTKVTGFVMGSGKIYSVTLNGYLIVSSASSGKVEFFKKIGSQITSSPIINNGKLFVYTAGKKSKIIGFD